MLYRAREQGGQPVEMTAHERMFELHMQNLVGNRMYLSRYGKEPVMLQIDQFVQELRKLAEVSPPSAIIFPPNTVGLPEGTFIPKAFLNYIADALEGKIID